jgi:hypothetical protein
LVSEVGTLEGRGLAKMEGGAPLGLAVISFFSGLEVEGWLKEARGLWPKKGWKMWGKSRVAMVGKG